LNPKAPRPCVFPRTQSEMIVREVTVANRAGLHTRPASMIVRTASKFQSDFYIRKDSYEINGKSIIGVMTLAAEKGASLTLLFDGEDAEEAANAVTELFENGFGEVQ
jgi:phosphocarrier protein HPr